ncbi:MAG: hypothetical protein BWY34_00540 [Parcubacteria group bacterium ADurb.Bin247]|nr:MAG: hypothetical protein BWY34_00540 [Parcubacteria group bacterium ADurb.Bin247]
MKKYVLLFSVAILFSFVLIQLSTKSSEVLSSSITNLFEFETIQLKRDKIKLDRPEVATGTERVLDLDNHRPEVATGTEQVLDLNNHRPEVATGTEQVLDLNNHRPEVATGTEQVSNLAFPIADSVQTKIKQKTQELAEANKEALEKAKEQKESIEFVSPKEKVVEVDRGIDQTINAINKQKESIDLVATDNQGEKEIINEINEKNEEITDILAKQQKNIISVKDNGNVSNIEKVEEINNEIMNIISDQGSIIKSIIGFEKEHEVINQITSLATELNQEDLSGKDIIEKYVDLYDNYEQVVSDFYESPEMQESLVQAREIVQETIREMSVSREEVELIEEIKNPKEEGPVLKDIFSVNDLVVQEKIYREDGSEDIAKLAISGFGPINSLIFLFLYSDPIMVYTETDSNGMWNYILEAELEDGNHEIYVASVDRAGNIIARSNAIPFVKEAAAVQLDFMPISLVGAQSVDFFDRKNITAISLIFLFILIVTIILTGISVSKKQYFQE